MVVSSIVQLAVAGATGFLFGISYGTAIRIGYEQVYPALFNDSSIKPEIGNIFTKLEDVYTKIGGLEAHKFGINQGIKNALKDIDADPELVELIKKNLLRDTLNITVNSPGTSKDDSGDSSLVDPSDQGGKGGGWSAERHRKQREAHDALILENKKSANARNRDTYTQQIRIIQSNQLPDGFSFGWLTTFFAKKWNVIPGGTFDLVPYPSATVVFGFLTLAYQRELARIYNKFQEDARETEEDVKSRVRKNHPTVKRITLSGGKIFIGDLKNMKFTRILMEGHQRGFNTKADGNQPGWPPIPSRLRSKITIAKIVHTNILKNWNNYSNV